MSPKVVRGRLARRVQLYTLSCVVLAVTLFMLVGFLLLPPPPGHAIGGPPPPYPGQADGSRPHRLPKPPADLPVKLFLSAGTALLSVVLGGSYLFARSLVRPLQHLEDVATAFGAGRKDARANLARSDEIGAVGDAFDSMADRTMRLIESQRELIANVSHELRTPLARIRVATELAIEGDASTAREILSEIDVDLTELETLINDVLVSARLDTAEEPLRREGFYLDEVVSGAQQRFASLAGKHELVVERPSEPIALSGDPALLRRAIDNVLDNARKYSEPSEPIALRVSQTEATACIEIEDRGIGIAADDLKHIFTPFFRTDRSRQRGTGGVGLGLSLTRKIIESHAGTIELSSHEGSGTTAKITLPRPTRGGTLP